MTLVELYEQTPVEQHANIKVVGGRVYVKNTDGSIDEYLLDSRDELVLLSSDRWLRDSVGRLESKLGV